MEIAAGVARIFIRGIFYAALIIGAFAMLGG